MGLFDILGVSCLAYGVVNIFYESTLKKSVRSIALGVFALVWFELGSIVAH